MPASKKKYFTLKENEIALVGRAMAHPARVRIMNLLDQQNFLRNCDLVNALSLSKSTVHDHLKKLTDADMIKTEYFMNSFYITKNNSVKVRIFD